MFWFFTGINYCHYYYELLRKEYKYWGTFIRVPWFQPGKIIRTSHTQTRFDPHNRGKDRIGFWIFHLLVRPLFSSLADDADEVIEKLRAMHIWVRIQMIHVHSDAILLMGWICSIMLMPDEWIILCMCTVTHVNVDEYIRYEGYGLRETM